MLIMQKISLLVKEEPCSENQGSEGWTKKFL